MPPAEQPTEEALENPQELIQRAIRDRPVAVSAETYIRKWDSFSKPVALKCDDNQIYVVKARQQANASMSRAITNEQVVATLGRTFCNCIPPVALVNVPVDLIASQPEMQHMIPGIGHGSLFDLSLTEKEGIAHFQSLENRERFAELAALCAWMPGGDLQFFYSKLEPHLVYSMDHGHFFPDGFSWTMQSLNSAPPPQLDNAIIQTCGLTRPEIGAAIKKLGTVKNCDIARAVAICPDEWGLTMEERIVLFQYLVNRLEQLKVHCL